MERMASASALELAPLARRHPGWIYQGTTLLDIDALSARLLRGCSLRRSARLLAG